MTKREKEKHFQFVKLCISLTKQGFQFTKTKGINFALTFDKISAKRLFSPYTKTPFVEKFVRIAGDKTKECFRFIQHADETK